MSRQRIKEIIANILNKSDKFCWAGLVMWFLGYNSFRKSFREYKTKDCKMEQICFCGKFKNGKRNANQPNIQR